MKPIHIFRPFCWTFHAPWTLKGELSNPADSDLALRFPCLLPGALCLGGVFAFGAGAGGGSHTRAHAHVQRRARGSGTGTICSANAALPLKEAKQRFQVRRQPAGGGAARAEIPGSVPESLASLEPVPCTHAHTQIHTGTHRARAPAHIAPGHPPRCCAARAGISRVRCLTLRTQTSLPLDFQGGILCMTASPSHPGRLREGFFPSSQPLAFLAGFKSGRSNGGFGGPSQCNLCSVAFEHLGILMVYILTDIQTDLESVVAQRAGRPHRRMGLQFCRAGACGTDCVSPVRGSTIAFLKRGTASPECMGVSG